jgi:hypothetical protein
MERCYGLAERFFVAGGRVDLDALRFASRAATAFCALAVRSSGVMVSNDRLPPALPPSFPPLEPCFLKNSSTSGGSFFLAMPLSYTGS